MNERDLTHDEEVEIAMAVMREQQQRDLEVGRRFLSRQRRTIRIREDLEEDAALRC